MSDRGVIMEWDEATGWGSIMLDGGNTLRFNRNACGKGVACAVGATVWVAQHVPYVGGQRRATSVQANANAKLTPLDLVKKKYELDEELRQRITRELGAAFDPARHDRVPHVDRQLAELGIAVDTTILSDDKTEPLGVVYQAEVLAAWIPFDPCFIAFAGIDGDAWGFLCYPPLLARGDAPVVKWSHEGERMAFEAPTFAHWLAKRGSSAKRKTWLAKCGFEAPASITTKTLAKEVRDIVMIGSDEERLAASLYMISSKDERIARLDALLACYRGWPDVLVQRAEVQRRVILAEQVYDAEVARLTREHHAAHRDIYSDS